MANIHRGEVTLSVAGRAYTLRPTFHIMCQIEERIGLSVAELLERIRRKGLLASEILMIVAVASRHDGSPTFDSQAALDLPAEQVDLHAIMPHIAQFLVQALGGSLHTAAPSNLTTARAPQALDYAQLLEAGYIVLRLQPAQFWQLTMTEFRVLLRAARPRRAALPEVSAVQAMMQRFPDAAAI